MLLTFSLHVSPNCFDQCKAWFPFDLYRIVESCYSSRFWIIADRLITIKNHNIIEIGSDLQPKRFLS